jgi:hypothetical protein
MKKALQEQIDEKQRKKDIEKQKAKIDEMKDVMRVKNEMKHMAVAEGMYDEKNDAPEA